MVVPSIRRFALQRLIAIFVGALALVACSREDSGQRFRSTDITGAEWGQDFHLTDHTGAPRSLADFRGKVVMLYFGYTNCPDMCPTTLTKMAQAVNRMGDDGRRVQGLFATVDPMRDKPALLARYVPAFHPTFLGLYADAATTAAAAKDFKVFYAAQPPGRNGFYTVDHSGAIFVFDTKGRLRLYVDTQLSVDAIVSDLKALLKE